jgi:gamma-glutamyltranspeptidase/glutathione hydrolase
MYRPVSDTWPDYLRAEGDVNVIGPLAVGVPGTLKGWAEAVDRFGRLDLEAVMQPAIRHAERGFRATPYLVEAVAETAADLARFPETARTFLPGGAALKAGDLVVQGDYAATLRLIAAKGPDVLYGGELGAAIADYIVRAGGILTATTSPAIRPSSALRSAGATAAMRSPARPRRPPAASTSWRC